MTIMNNFDFTFQDSYSGFWNIEGIGNHIAGTLFLYENSIELDLFYEGTIDLTNRKIKFVQGRAFSKNYFGKEKEYNFVLWGFDFLKGTGLRVINHSIFDVKGLYIYQNSFCTNEINSVCIRTPLFDRWASSFSKKGYKECDILSSDRVKVEYSSLGSLTLYRDPNTDFRIFIYFGRQTSFKNNDVSIKLRNFLNIGFGKTIDINEANKQIEIVKYFFFLVWNITFSPTFIEFRTPKGNFILKLSNKHTFEYVWNSGNAGPFTTIDDFGELKDLSPDDTFFSQQLESSISKWLELYTNYNDALDTYFETISNRYITPSMQIKNNISTIDALSENFKDETDNDRQIDEQQDTLESIFNKIEDRLNESEKKQLKKLMFSKKRKKQKKPLRDRFLILLKSISELLTDDINKDFVDKIVNTRNNLTHPKEEIYPAFSYNEYDEAAYLLTKVIRAYLLKKIDIKPKVIRKIIKF